MKNNCDTCVGFTCCSSKNNFTSSDKDGNSVWVTKEEIDLIKDKLHGSLDIFEYPVEGAMFGRMYRKEDGSCYFLSKQGCYIYDYRPWDCKMFPYDYDLIDGDLWLVKHVNLCPEHVEDQRTVGEVLELFYGLNPPVEGASLDPATYIKVCTIGRM